MSLITRLRNLFDSDRHGRELDHELDFHIAERVDGLVAHGMERGEAERQARIQFGHRQGLKEDTRAIGIVAWIDTLGTDLRYAVRGLRANPGFT
ncbi:MAG: permease prefix domain 1-containing protein, partial [Gemmatimonadota bacterium]